MTDYELESGLWVEFEKAPIDIKNSVSDDTELEVIPQIGGGIELYVDRLDHKKPSKHIYLNDTAIDELITALSYYKYRKLEHGSWKKHGY